MHEEEYKIVNFEHYCKTCKHWKEDDEGHEYPCNECLENPTNLYSHKPINWEEA